MTKHVTIDNANFEVSELVSYLQRGLNLLDNSREAMLDFKELIEEAAEKTKLEKKVVSKFIKARFKDKTKEVVKDGELFAALNDAVDNN